MNKVILMGRLTADPELRYSSSSVPICRFTIAVDRPYVKQGEERQADFFRIVTWRSTAEFVSRYFKKGVRILVEGWLKNNNYDDNQGAKHYSVDVQAENVYFADGKKEDLPSAGGFTPPPQNNNQQTYGFLPTDEDDDDLPF